MAEKPHQVLRRRRAGWMRDQVLQTIRSAHGPISAWAIARQLAASERAIHPSGVFRSVNELMAAGLVERIGTLACYVPSRGPSIAAICIDCGSCREIAAEGLNADVIALTRTAGWVSARVVTEVVGRSRECEAAWIEAVSG